MIDGQCRINIKKNIIKNKINNSNNSIKIIIIIINNGNKQEKGSQPSDGHGTH